MNTTWTVAEDMGRWVRNHPCASEADAKAVVARIHAERDQPLCPVLVHIRTPAGTTTRA